MFQKKKYAVLMGISIFLTSIIANVAYAKKAKDYMTVVCNKPVNGGTFSGGASSELHSCDTLFCHKGKTKKYKDHKFCEGGEYEKINHRIFGTVKQKIICVVPPTYPKPEDPEGLCDSYLE